MSLKGLGCDEFIDHFKDESETMCLWRGWGAVIYKGLTEIGPVMGRRPRNNSENAHRIADAWFFENFGVHFRSQSLFCTGSKSVAGNFGNVYPAIPFDGFRFCWSPKIRDLYSEVSLNFIDPSDTISLIGLLEAGDYTDQKFHMAIQSGCEIMVAASGFYVIGE